MAIKLVVASLTEVPDTLRSLYEQKDGKYVLAVEGDIPGFVKAQELAEANGKIVEFRDNNKRLMTALGVDSAASGAIETALQRAGLIAGLTPEKLAALKDLDPEAARAALARVADLEKKGLKTGEDMAAQVKAAIEAAVGPIKQELESERQARKQAQERADEALLRQTIGDRYLKAGGKPSALDFIVAEFKRDFRVVDNAVKAQDTKFSAERPGQLLSEEEWLNAATKKFDFAFEASKGGGAAPAGGASSKPHAGGSFRTTSGAEIKTEGITVLQ